MVLCQSITISKHYVQNKLSRCFKMLIKPQLQWEFHHHPKSQPTKWRGQEKWREPKIEKVFSPTCIDWQITNNYNYLFDFFFVMKVNPLGKSNDWVWQVNMWTNAGNGMKIPKPKHVTVWWGQWKGSKETASGEKLRVWFGKIMCWWAIVVKDWTVNLSWTCCFFSPNNGWSPTMWHMRSGPSVEP